MLTRWATYLCLSLVGVVPGLATAAEAALLLSRVASGLDRPLFATAPAGDTSRLFIVEQHSGKILILDLGDLTVNAVPFLTVPDLSTGNEQGLLGLAFDPSYGSNGLFYVNFTDSSGDTHVMRYHVSADPDVADPASAHQILEIDQPQGNHNGGWIAFGPDGYLYIASGDGGASNDEGPGHTEPGGNSQDTTGNLLGKLLRINVGSDDFPGDADRNYAIPATNPFVGVAGDDEIWAFGLRNPWRCSFDRQTGDLYIADVGQGAREEINVQPAASSGGENYGWRLREGTQATAGDVGGPKPSGAIDPIYEYNHGFGSTEGYSVSGGYVYRGPITSLQGQYFFADYVSERIWSLTWDGSLPSTFDGTNHSGFTDRTTAFTPNVGSIDEVASFAEDAAGNLYILDLGGEIFRIDEAPELGATDHFMFYSVAPPATEPEHVAFGPLTLADQFRTAEYDVYAPTALGLPADKSSEGINDSATHLEEYKLKPSVDTARFTRRDGVTVINSCNTLRVSVTKPISLLVPTAMSVTAPVPAPDPLAHDVDHFLCYRAKVQTKLPKRMQVDVVDTFQSRRYDLKKVTKLCVPVAKSGTPVYLSGPDAGTPKVITAAAVGTPQDHLLCYKASLARRAIPQSGCLPSDPSNPGTTILPTPARHAPRLGIHVNNQFGSAQVSSKKDIELCIPTAKIVSP